MTEPTPGEAAAPKSAAEIIEARRLDMAARALDEPLSPTLGLRCPRCGERLPRAEGEPPEGKPGPPEEKAPEEKPGEAAPRYVATCPRCMVEVRSAAAAETLVPVKGVLIELLRGAFYVPRGLFRIVRSPSLWKFAVVPFLLNVAVIALGFLFAQYVVAEWLQGVIDRWNQAEGAWGYLSHLLVGLKWVVRVLVPLVVAWLIVAPPFCILYKLLFMPVMEIMTEATERLVLGFDDDLPFDFGRFYANMVVAILDAVILTFLQLVLLVVLLPLNLVPFIGNVIWMVVPPAMFAGMDYTDINLVRRSYTTREKVRLWRAYQWRFFGYGIAFFALITVPLVNVVVIPAAAAGGALLYLELERK